MPLPTGRMVPAIPAGGFWSEQEVAALPGARRVADDAVFTGSDPSTYAFNKIAIQRNIYRLELP